MNMHRNRPGLTAPRDLRLWRRGDVPERETRVDLRELSGDFELVAEAIDPGACVVLQGAIRVTGLPGDRPAFVYVGSDGRRHALTIDPNAIALDGIDTEADPDLPESGIFLPDSGPPLAFGGPGQPSLEEILSGSYVQPGSDTPVSPEGSFQIVGDDPAPEVRDPAFGLPDDVAFPDHGGIVSVLSPDATVLTDCDTRPAFLLRRGDRVLTRCHGFQEVGWTGRPRHARPEDMFYVATQAGALRATDAPSGHFLLLSRTLGNPRACASA